MTTSQEKDYPLLTVVVVALSIMMCVQLFGSYWDTNYRVALVKPVYECDFNLRTHVVTMPCVIRSVSYEKID